MKKISIVYHSGYGHTEVIAQEISKGIENEGCKPLLIKISSEGKIEENYWQELENSDAIVFGAPTYMGSLSGPFKMFADASSKPWFVQKWKDKIAGGFTNSGGLSGDKLSSILQLVILAEQHGMIWVGNAFMPSGNSANDTNRLSSFTGLMSQSDNVAPDVSPPSGDKKSAEMYGQRIAQATLRWN